MRPFYFLMLFSTAALCNDKVHFERAEQPAYQATLEIMRTHSEQQKNYNIVIDMADYAEFPVTGLNDNPSSLHIEPSPELPEGKFLVDIEIHAQFQNSKDDGPYSTINMNTQLPFSFGERILIGGHDSNLGSTQIWLTMDEYKKR